MSAQGELLASLGLCDGTPEWWAHYVEILTRAPHFDDEDTDGFAKSRGLDPGAVREAFSPSWNRGPTYPWSAGPLVRYPYQYDGGPADTDTCRGPVWIDRSGRRTYGCNGSCRWKTK